MKKVTLGSVWISRAGNEVVETFGTLVRWILDRRVTPG